VMKFPTQQHLTNQLAGPLSLGGFTNGQPDRSVATALIQPKFPNVTLAQLQANPSLAEHDPGPFAGPPSPSSDATSIDRLNVLNAGSGANDGATVTATNPSGLGTAGPLTQNIGTSTNPQYITIPAGTTSRDIEIRDVLPGKGNDTFPVSGTLPPDNTTFGGI